MDTVSYILMLLAPHIQHVGPVITYESTLAGIDPYVVLALIERESSFKPTAVSQVGLDFGLMQIRRTGFCLEHMPTVPDYVLKTPEYNTHVGIPCLAALISKCGNILHGLGRFKGAGCRATTYGKAILHRAAKLRILAAASLWWASR